MPDSTDTASAPDMCLLLRAYGEQRWLIAEVVPVLRELERPHAVAEDELPAALAYLEMLWLQARRLARETDAAARETDEAAAAPDRRDSGCSAVLIEKAKRYHAAIRRLRYAVGGRVTRLTAPQEPLARPEHASH